VIRQGTVIAHYPFWFLQTFLALGMYTANCFVAYAHMSLRHKNRPLILLFRVKPFQKARPMIVWEGFCAQLSLGQLVSRCILVFGKLHDPCT
jgi:hypothetical protein